MVTVITTYKSRKQETAYSYPNRSIEFSKTSVKDVIGNICANEHPVIHKHW